MKSIIILLERKFAALKALVYFHAYQWLRKVCRICNNLTPRVPFPRDLIVLFRKEKEIAASAIIYGGKIFSWTLNDTDGRSKEFNFYDDYAWYRWLAMYRHHHFQWMRPDDSLLGEISKKVISVGRATWRNLFRRYVAPELDWHDAYSLPDIYYSIKTIGHIPRSVLDIGGGWGRLGMAWSAVGVQEIGITDSIEQSYMIQHQYLSSIPRTHFIEVLTKKDAQLFPGNSRAIFHFPFWQLSKVPSRSIEVVSTIQVLREVSREFLEFLFSQLQRVLVKGGIFYVRDNDHDYKTQCMHDIKITKTLEAMGFEVIRFDGLVQSRHIHGIPRIFRWQG